MIDLGRIDSVVADLLRHAAGLRAHAGHSSHPAEQADLLERAREFEQMASAADESSGWPRPGG
jgi:hypothetical protein